MEWFLMATETLTLDQKTIDTVKATVCIWQVKNV